MPKVSVLMAAFNAARYIDSALGSLVSQSFQDWELIVIDDKSVDNTLAILNRWALEDRRIKVSSNDANLGAGVTRKRAQDLASGVYVAILDADDVALPSWLAELVGHLDSNPDIVLVSSSRVLVDQGGRRIRALHEAIDGPAAKWRLLFGNPISHPSCVYRLSCARTVGGYLPYAIMEDWGFFSRLLQEGSVMQTEKNLMMYRVHGRSLTQTLGPCRNACEPAAEQIISEGVLRHTGQGVPRGLIWYLYRNRPIFRGEPSESKRALAFLQNVCRVFSATHREEIRRATGNASAVAAGMLDDLANVLRTGCWSPTTVLGSLRCVAQCVGVTSLFAPVCLLKVLKLASIPVSLRLIHSGR